MTPYKSALKQRYRSECGGAPWTSEAQSLLDLDPEFFAKALDLRQVPYLKQHLSLKQKELIRLAIDCTITRGFPKEDIRLSLQRAAAQGASVEEILETVQCASVLGIHTFTLGLPVLIEALREEGSLEAAVPSFNTLDEEQKRLKQAYIQKRGYWNEATVGQQLRMDKEVFEAYTAYSSHPAKRDALGQKFRELIYIAIDVNTTHIFPVGLKIHIKNARRLGASVGEILEVYELATPLGFQSALVVAGLMHEVIGDNVTEN